jgi:hypothetical protein
MLILHILISILALIINSLTLVRTLRSKALQSNSLIRLALNMSLGSVASGVILIIFGSSIIRVCLEGGAILVSFALLQLAHRSVSNELAKV